MDDWIDLPAGFADLSQAKAWSKSLDQAKSRVESLRLIELVFRLEALFEARPEVSFITVGAGRSRPGIELCVWVSAEGEGVVELDAWLARRARRDPVRDLGPLGPDYEREALEGIGKEARAAEALMESEPGALTEAKGLSGYQIARIERAQSSWRDICQALGAASAERAIERSQIERETQSGRARQEPRAL